ncbi:MAG: GDP-mannose 4,6-dehydratase, partial [Anaerolineae bacterium]|nr:GDP-mannose 4,6-dehydratase [Anaerolineae bacterium]
SQTRDFTYVEDTARGILLAGTHEAAIGKTLNLGSGYEIPIHELAETVKQVCGVPDAEIIHEIPRPGDVLRLYADSSRAGELVGFEPQVSLAEGLQRLKTWYEGQGTSPEDLLQSETVRNWEA